MPRWRGWEAERAAKEEERLEAMRSDTCSSASIALGRLPFEGLWVFMPLSVPVVYCYELNSYWVGLKECREHFQELYAFERGSHGVHIEIPGRR